MRKYNLTKKILAICLIVTFPCCASYHPLPLMPKSIEQANKAPEMKDIRIKASKIVHPILKPIQFDESDGLSPDEAAILAVIANPFLRVARDARGLASAQLLQAGILPNPNLSYSFETPVGGSTHDKVNAFDLGLDWNIRPILIRNLRIAASHAHASSIDIEIAWKEWQVAEAAKLCVYHLIIAKKRFLLLKKARYITELLYKKSNKTVNMGIETNKSLFNIQMLYQEIQRKFLQARADINSKRLELKKILGLPGNSKIKLEKNIPLPDINHIPSAQELFKGIEKRRLDLLALRYGYKSQEERVRAAIRSQFPEINLGLKYAKDTDNVKTIGFGISISLPIFNRAQGKIAIERATRKQLFDEYMARLFETQFNITKIIQMMRSTLEQLKDINKEIQNIQLLQKHYCNAFNQGNLSITDYYQIVLQWYNKKLQELDLRSQLAKFYIALEIASGRYISTEPKSISRSAIKSGDVK